MSSLVFSAAWTLCTCLFNSTKHLQPLYM